MKTHAFESYREKYENVRMKREDGILEVALHTRGGSLVFNGYVHEALVHAFRDIGDDPDNHVVILTGTGDEFCARISSDGFDFFAQDLVIARRREEIEPVRRDSGAELVSRTGEDHDVVVRIVADVAERVN